MTHVDLDILAQEAILMRTAHANQCLVEADEHCRLDAGQDVDAYVAARVADWDVAHPAHAELIREWAAREVTC